MLVDTCAWVDYADYGDEEKDIDEKLVAYLEHHMLRQGRIFTTPLIMHEFLHGLSKDKDYKDWLLAFGTYDKYWFEDQEAAVLGAVELNRSCRKKGYTIRKPNDCMIALIALEFDLPLLTKGRDFEHIAEVFPKLKLIDYERK